MHTYVVCVFSKYAGRYVEGEVHKTDNDMLLKYIYVEVVEMWHYVTWMLSILIQVIIQGGSNGIYSYLLHYNYAVCVSLW